MVMIIILMVILTHQMEEFAEIIMHNLVTQL
jgi:hypothetical protein